MALQVLVAREEERHPGFGKDEPNHKEVLGQLERIVTSPLFRNSKRYPAFLRFIVENTLAGHTDLLKERTLGIEVFGRPHEYDTNADPVVRVTAGEIRKRLAQYYQIPGHEFELRVDVPVGSYVPHFDQPHYPAPHPAPEPEFLGGGHVPPFAPETLPTGHAFAHEPEGFAPPTEVQPSERRSKRSLWRRSFPLRGLVSLTLGSALAVGLFSVASARRNAGWNYFWAPVLHADSPALIVLGVHSLGPDGKDLSPGNDDGVAGVKQNQSMLASMTSSDMVPVTDVVSYSSIVQLLSHEEHAYHTQGSAATTFEQLQHGPLISIGGLDNLWTLRLTAGLRYRFHGQRGSVGGIQDNDHPEVVWQFDNAQRATSNSRDYALVASFFDPRIEQHVLIAAGLGKSGTAAAANFLTKKQYLREWLERAALRGKKNVELVLSTEIVEGQPGPPHVIAQAVW